MTRRSGRAPRGQRVVGQVPRNHGPNVTLIAALDREGLLGELPITGALDGAAFDAYVTRILERSGFESAYNLEGGLDAYSSVDASVPRY